MTSRLYAVVMKGELKQEVQRLRRMVADAEGNVATRERDGDAEAATVWRGIADAAAAELEAAAASYRARFGE